MTGGYTKLGWLPFLRLPRLLRGKLFGLPSLLVVENSISGAAYSMRCICVTIAHITFFSGNDQTEFSKKLNLSRNRPCPQRTGCRIRTAETCAKTSRCAASVWISAAVRLKAGLITNRFQRIKVRGAGQLPCLLAFGKTLRVRGRA